MIRADRERPIRVELIKLGYHIRALQWALEMSEKMPLEELFYWSRTMAHATREDEYGLGKTYMRIHRAAAESKGVKARFDR